MADFDAMRERIRKGNGFIAALDQSGGSTPKALGLYGVGEDRFSNDEEMYDLIHAMRSRIVDAPAFTGDKVVGAILFQQTLEREFGGKPTAAYLWEERQVVPFVKIDEGLADAEGGMQLMKPITGLDDLLSRSKAKGVFGTKERSVIGKADEAGIRKVVAQQFDVARQVLAHGMVPIIEPEVTISISDKAEAERMLLDASLEALDAVGEEVMFKVTLPEQDNLYAPLVDHPKVLKVVALSGGYAREEANARLSRQRGMIASFSRALTEGLSEGQSDDAFNRTIGATIDSIHAASVAG
ncbi:fructose bisphosphate aldolase [Jannaschia sp. Os4]|uniref:fructose bisphosphate aldolase n=1 Tax=Jannaschia sp. Os4 TaxID=2807617 RepID=UPI001939C34F|nr:fructose bisphosphate aldolase [Jannaschia sp. Os4]MBM2576798.1 fructose bisphosphate aldolase [Jannaschia sp. Os4]